MYAGGSQGVASGSESPRNGHAAHEWLDGALSIRQRLGNLLGFTYQHDQVGVAGQAVEVRTEGADEVIEFAELVGLLEGYSAELERYRCRETAGATRHGILQKRRVRGAIRAEEELRVARGGSSHEFLAVGFTFEYRQAVVFGIEAGGPALT